MNPIPAPCWHKCLGVESKLNQGNKRRRNPSTIKINFKAMKEMRNLCILSHERGCIRPREEGVCVYLATRTLLRWPSKHFWIARKLCSLLRLIWRKFIVKQLVIFWPCRYTRRLSLLDLGISVRMSHRFLVSKSTHYQNIVSSQSCGQYRCSLSYINNIGTISVVLAILILAGNILNFKPWLRW